MNVTRNAIVNANAIVNHISNSYLFLAIFSQPKLWLYWQFDLVSSYQLQYIFGRNVLVFQDSKFSLKIRLYLPRNVAGLTNHLQLLSSGDFQQTCGKMHV